jgi:putative hydrolase of the HAD superfamily
MSQFPDKSFQVPTHIRNIIFDLGGVFINLDNSLTEKSFRHLGAKDFSNYFGHGFAASFFIDYELGKITDEEFMSALRSMLGKNVPDNELVEAWNALLLDFPKERIELLKTINNKYRLFLFSNTNALHLEAVKKIFLKTFPGESLEDYFEKTYYSHILQLRKPDKISFEYIIRENELDPAITLFVDDALINVEGARAAGLEGYFLDKGQTVTNIRW